MENKQQQILWILQEKFGGKMTAAAKKDIMRLKAGEPLDHIIGFVEFLGCKILVGPNVLIPRFETEFWVDQVIGNWELGIGNFRILDMFAGSGAIGVAVVKQVTNSHVTFVDSQKPALGQIKKNCVVNKIPKSKYEIVQSDVFDSSSKLLNAKFQYIFANPPYIPTTRAAKIQNSVINHEPHAALFGGRDGLDYVRKFLAQAKNRLNSGGKIYMEFDSPQKSTIEKIVKKEGYTSWQFHKDQYNRWRWITITI